MMSATTDVLPRGLLSDSLLSRLPFVSRAMICEPIGATTVPALCPNDLPVSPKPSTSRLGTKRREEKLAFKPQRSKSKEVREWVPGSG